MAATTIGAFRDSVGDRVGLVKKLVGFHAWNRCTQRSPVDTGRYRAAWNLAIGSADLSVPAPAPVVATPRPPVIGEVPVGEPVIVSNNLPYAPSLEKGHSQQAPNGVAALAVRDALAAFEGVVREVKALGEQGAL